MFILCSLPPRLKQPLDLVENVVDQTTFAGFRPGEAHDPAIAADFAPDRQPLFQGQQPTRAAGFGGGGVGLGGERLGQGRDQGGPLAGQAIAPVFL